MKKRMFSFAMVMVIVLGSVAVSLKVGNAVVQAADDYPAKYKNEAKDAVVDEWNYYNRECTSFVAHCLNSRNGVMFHNMYLNQHFGDARTWCSAANRAGITVDMNPAVGSVAFWNYSPWGHVAWVSEVRGSTVVIEEYNKGGTGKYNTREIAASNPDGYIHIKDLPKENRLIPDGWYIIKTACDPNGEFVANVAGFSDQNCANLILYKWQGGLDNEIYYFKYVEDGYYSIMTKYGKYLHVADERFSPTNIHQYESCEHPNALWQIQEAGDGKYYLRNKNTGLYMDLSFAIVEADQNIWAHEFNSSIAEKWVLVPCNEQGQVLATVRYSVTARSGLILRKGPSKSYKKILTIPFGKEVRLLEDCQNGWFKVSYNENYIGYVSANYLREK